MRIYWFEDRVQAVYEDMISCLYGHIYESLYPGIERVDGSGGDGGRDIQIRTPEGLHIIQLKSFTGRIGKEKGRRRQIERSLTRAAEQQPVRWELVVPVELTEGEWDWFNGLRDKYEFPLMCRDATWLDEQIAKVPEIYRYYVDGAAEEILREVKELRRAQSLDGLQNTRDLLRQLKRIDEKMKDVSPHYHLNHSSRNGQRRIWLTPRYVGAEKHCPITIRTRIVFPKRPETIEIRDQLQEMLDFGFGKVDIPADYVDHFEVDGPPVVASEWSEESQGVALSIEALPETIDDSAQLRIVTPNGSLLGSLPLRFVTVSHGHIGAKAVAEDRTGCVTVTLTFDSRRETTSINLRTDFAGKMAPVGLGVIEVLRHCNSPNEIEIWHESGVRLASFDLPVRSIEPFENERNLLTAIDEVVSYANCPVLVPADLDQGALENIYRAAALVRGERVGFSTRLATLSGEVTDIDELREKLHGTEGMLVQTDEEYGVDVGGIWIELGSVRRVMSKAKLQNGDELFGPDSQLMAGQEMELLFEPRDGCECWFELVQEAG